MALQDKLSLLDIKRQAVLDCEADIAAKKTEFEAALADMASEFIFPSDSKIIKGDTILKVVSVDSVSGTSSENVVFELKVRFPIGTLFGEPKKFQIPLSSMNDWTLITQ